MQAVPHDDYYHAFGIAHGVRRSPAPLLPVPQQPLVMLRDHGTWKSQASPYDFRFENGKGRSNHYAHHVDHQPVDSYRYENELDIGRKGQHTGIPYYAFEHGKRRWNDNAHNVHHQPEVSHGYENYAESGSKGEHIGIPYYAFENGKRRWNDNAHNIYHQPEDSHCSENYAESGSKGEHRGNSIPIPTLDWDVKQAMQERTARLQNRRVQEHRQQRTNFARFTCRNRLESRWQQHLEAPTHMSAHEYINPILQQHGNHVISRQLKIRPSSSIAYSKSRSPTRIRPSSMFRERSAQSPRPSKSKNGIERSRRKPEDMVPHNGTAAAMTDESAPKIPDEKRNSPAIKQTDQRIRFSWTHKKPYYMDVHTGDTTWLSGETKMLENTLFRLNKYALELHVNGRHAEAMEVDKYCLEARNKTHGFGLSTEVSVQEID